jgi:catechol 2,3-dioxygenase-like lactoylglutathione lyase family enzyme
MQSNSKPFIQRVARLHAIVTVALTLFASHLAFATEAVVRSVESVAVTVSDMDRSMAFYETVLSFKRESDRELVGEEVEHLYGVFGARVRIVRERLGDEHLDLVEFLAPVGRPIPIDSKSNDLWFQHVAVIVSDMDRAYRWLRDHKVQHASSGPQLLPDWNPNAGGIAAFYFRDPDGHNLEVLHFPQGKGDAKWHRKSSELFLGIDHTAIAIADTEASLKFYRDTLGMRVAGMSENYGTEQEHLNNVFGARLRITAMRAASGPGVEFLEYLAPRTGKPMPVDTQSNDLWHWHIVMGADVAAADASLRSNVSKYVSPGVVAEDKASPSRALMVRDPDGHALVLRQSNR